VLATAGYNVARVMTWNFSNVPEVAPVAVRRHRPVVQDSTDRSMSKHPARLAHSRVGATRLPSASLLIRAPSNREARVLFRQGWILQEDEPKRRPIKQVRLSLLIGLSFLPEDYSGMSPLLGIRRENRLLVLLAAFRLNLGLECLEGLALSMCDQGEVALRPYRRAGIAVKDSEFPPVYRPLFLS